MKVRGNNLYCVPKECVNVYYGGYEKAEQYPEELDIRRKIWTNLMETVTELENIQFQASSEAGEVTIVADWPHYNDEKMPCTRSVYIVRSYLS